jgi:oligosaccharyltransferase complex subunit gamma
MITLLDLEGHDSINPDFRASTSTQRHHTSTMRWLQLLTASVLPFAALAAKKSSGNRFDDFRAKSLSSGPLKLDDASYTQLTKAPRDYSVAVLLTALETRFGCVLCREFQPEWDLLSKSWVKGDKNGASRLLYGTLDFVDGKNTFQSVRSGSGSVYEKMNAHKYR